MASNSRVSVDQDVLASAKVIEDMTIMNITAFEQEFISQTGSNHLRPTLGNGNYLGNSLFNTEFEGPALVLAATRDNDVDRLMQMDPVEMVRQATVIKQRFLGEALLSTIDETYQKNSSHTVRGSITTEQVRLIVSRGVGIVMGSIFLVLSIASAILLLLVSNDRRPLYLRMDPSQSSTAASLLRDAATTGRFNDLDRATAEGIESALVDRVFSLHDGHLKDRTDEAAMSNQLERISSSSEKLRSADWRPFILRRRAGFILTLYLSCILAAFVTVYTLSKRKPLYQAAFVYSIELGKANVTTLATYSIIPTLIAVGTKLWWTTIDRAYRRLTPFLTMVSSASLRSAKSPCISYVTLPIAWITVVAAQRRHWLLFIVTFGTLTSEILQISMAALCSRELGVMDFDVSLAAQYRLRSIPHVFEDKRYIYRQGESIAYPRIAQRVYGGDQYQTSWVYGSLSELAFGASSPAWSKDGWSFPPVDLQKISADIPERFKQKHGDTLASMNVSLVARGLRGRLECTPIDQPSRWTVQISNFTDMLPHNQTTTETRPKISTGFEFTSRVRVVDLPGYSGQQPGVVNMGQWLHFNYSSSSKSGSPLYNPEYPQNFTVLWTNSSYPYRYNAEISGVNEEEFDPPPRLIFSERPQVQALNCQPIFETTIARITLDVADRRLKHYEVLEDIIPAEHGWSNRFERHYANEMRYYGDSWDQPGGWGTDEFKAFNRTVSWGYLFQLALLGACNTQGFVTGDGILKAEGVAGPTPFSFIEPDLYSDPFSYAALGLAGNDRDSLLNAPILSNATQRVFSTFFQWFVSTRTGYKDDYWAFEPIGATFPSSLDFGATESTVTHRKVITHAETLCDSSFSTYVRSRSDGVQTLLSGSCVSPITTKYDPTTWTEIYTTIESPSSLTASSTSSPAIARQVTEPTMTSNAQPLKRSTTPIALPQNDTIPATVHIHTETLVISPVALFISVAIVAILTAITAVIYWVQNSQLNLLPRDFDSPASILAAVYASEKLKGWASQQDKRLTTEKNSSGSKNNKVNKDDKSVAAYMGYFTGADGKEHWGIELVHEHSPLLATESSEDTQALCQTEEMPYSLPLLASSEVLPGHVTAERPASIHSHVASFNDVRPQSSTAS